MSLFLPRQFIPNPAEPGPAKWHTSEYPHAAASLFSGHLSFQFCVSLWPLARAPLLLEHQAVPATRVPTKMTGSHRAGLNWPTKQASTVSSGVSPNDEPLLCHRESAQMMRLHPAVGHPCGWAGLTCQTGTRTAGLN